MTAKILITPLTCRQGQQGAEDQRKACRPTDMHLRLKITITYANTAYLL